MIKFIKSKNKNLMKVEIKGNDLIVTMPLDKKGKLSSSKKSLVVASTNGNQKTGVKIGDKELILGLNAYVKADE